MGPLLRAGYMMSTIVAIIGSVVTVYATRQFMKPKPVAVIYRKR